jgi:hypothetical protein
MRHGFSRMRAIVEDQAIAGFVQAQLGCHRGGFQQQMTQDGLILRLGSGDSGDGFLGYDENMHRRLRVKVTKGKHLVILENNVRRQFTRDELFEQRLVHTRNQQTTKEQLETLDSRTRQSRMKRLI